MSKGAYALKYPRVRQDVLRHEIVPYCADKCAKERAIYGWTGEQYRKCLEQCIESRVKEWAKATYGE